MVKANAVDVVEAARQNQVADVRLVCQYAPEKANNKDWVMLLLCMLRLILLGLWDRMSPQLFTRIPPTARRRWLHELLLGAGASVDAKDKMRAGCTCLGDVC